MLKISTNINSEEFDSNISLRGLLKSFLEDERNDITIRPLSEQIGIAEQTLKKFIDGEGDIKMSYAIQIMELLNLSENQFITAYNNDMDSSDIEKHNKTKEIAYVYQKFDIQTLKKIGIIKRSKIDEYAEQISQFLGFNSIYEYDSLRLGISLFSKSRLEVSAKKEKKMVEFWLKCAYRFFTSTHNPYAYDRDLLMEFLKRISKHTVDVERGLEKVVQILFRLGVTVLVHEYVLNTTSFGVSMIIDGKPCIVITDMNKQYYKLWMNLLHELYHIIYDWEILERVNFHISDRESPELIFNEELADKFSWDVLVNPQIQKEIHKIVTMRYKVNELASKLNVDTSIIYGVYLEQISDSNKKSREFARLNKSLLKQSNNAVLKINFDPISQKSLTTAIEKMKDTVYKISI